MQKYVDCLPKKRVHNMYMYITKYVNPFSIKSFNMYQSIITTGALQQILTIKYISNLMFLHEEETLRINSFIMCVYL